MRGVTPRRVLTLVIGATAAVFLILYVLHFAFVQRVGSVSSRAIYLDTLVLSVPVVVLASGALYFRGQSVERRYVPRVLGWCYGGGVAITVVIVVTVAAADAEFEAVEPLVLLHAAGGLGTSIGFLMGVLEFRAITENQARARAEWDAQRSRREREQVKLLNKYLRHEVLNNVQVIDANATLLAEELDDTDRHDRIVAIQERSEDVGQFVQSIRRILDSSDFTLELEPIDVTTLIDDELDKLARSYPAVDVARPDDDRVFVQADTLLSTAFSNLFENAVEHNPDTVTIDVSVRRQEETVTVAISDDGDGIDPAARERLFEPAESGDHGYGLYLSRTLVHLYGGELRLVDCEAGTTFEIQLRAASADTDRQRVTATTD